MILFFLKNISRRISKFRTSVQSAMVRSSKSQPWTVEEHAKFVEGVRKLGKGRWAVISKEFVPTRTPTQVASHAQKYFIRLAKKQENKRIRKSIFDTVDVKPTTVDVDGYSSSSEKTKTIPVVPRAKVVPVRTVTPETIRPIPVAPFQPVILPPEMHFGIFYYNIMYSNWCRSLRQQQIRL